MPGLMPWNAPRNSSIPHELVIRLYLSRVRLQSDFSPTAVRLETLRKAVRVGRSVAAFQTDLMRTELPRLEEEFWIERASVPLRIDLRDPTAYTVRVELVVP